MSVSLYRNLNKIILNNEKKYLFNRIIINSFYTNRKEKQNHINFNGLYFLSGLVLSTIYFKRKKIYETFSNVKNHVLPTIRAASVISPSNIPKGNRANFNFIAQVVEEVAPSVVYIEIKDTKRYDFFTRKPITVSNGSGFIVKEDGLILTNAHVVINKPSCQVEVRLVSGETYIGVVEKVDSESDLATVRIPCKNLKPLNLGQSSDLKAGEWVVAIGSPLNLSNTVTAGVVSSTTRGSDELGLAKKHMTYIQTDAAITFGNSGGPLVNLDGEVIGINSMKVTAGISFAIPSDYALEFLNKATHSMKLAKGRKYMGITMLTLTPSIINEMRQKRFLSEPLPDDVRHGVLIYKVIIGSPAHLGGLIPGDIITHINDKPVKSASDIYEILSDDSTSMLKIAIVRSNGSKEIINVVPEIS